MNKQLAVFSIAILLTVTVTASIDLSQTADAAKATGTYIKKYGSATQSQVCGDKLCSEIPPEERDNMKQRVSPKSDSSSQTNLNDIMDRMDKVHEKHQTHMMKMWQTMTLHEQSQMIQKMSPMIEKMESMDMTQHMSMMGDMMSDKQHINMMAKRLWVKNLSTMRP